MTTEIGFSHCNDGLMVEWKEKIYDAEYDMVITHSYEYLFLEPITKDEFIKIDELAKKSISQSLKETADKNRRKILHDEAIRASNMETV